MIHPATIGAVIAIIVMAGLLINNAAGHPAPVKPWEDCQQAAPPAYIATLQQRSITP